ncbi:ComF family protein [Patescibacteria group bacterium]|nr:ComF family protein [Patescibacteria group bacterium]MBU4458464.1 ComF family protein [Patescibacteria group bacterium]
MNKIKKKFLDLFFPKKCLGCGKSDTYLCTDCFKQIQIILIVERPKDAYLDRIISVTNYANSLIRELIKSFKYYYVQELSEPLSQLLIRVLENFDTSFKVFNFIIIPIPLHEHRLRYRGFNQAELLAKQIANHFNLPIETNILKRIVPTGPQANIKDINKRKNNIKDVFNIIPNSVEGKNILLIDDVCTTGATLIEAARVLKLNGAREIWALVVAKG